MTYKSKRTLTSMTTGLLLLIGYFIYATGNQAPAAEDLRGWAILMLSFIGISVVASIVIQILFHILFSVGIAIGQEGTDDKEVERMISSAMVEDEMDKAISLRSSHVGYICAGVGFVAGLAGLALNLLPVLVLHIMFVFFAVGSLVEGGISIYLYERGV